MSLSRLVVCGLEVKFQTLVVFPLCVFLFKPRSNEHNEQRTWLVACVVKGFSVAVTGSDLKLSLVGKGEELG